MRADDLSWVQNIPAMQPANPGVASYADAYRSPLELPTGHHHFRLLSQDSQGAGPLRLMIHMPMQGHPIFELDGFSGQIVDHGHHPFRLQFQGHDGAKAFLRIDTPEGKPQWYVEVERHGQVQRFRGDYPVF